MHERHYTDKGKIEITIRFKNRAWDQTEQETLYQIITRGGNRVILLNKVSEVSENDWVPGVFDLALNSIITKIKDILEKPTDPEQPHRVEIVDELTGERFEYRFHKKGDQRQILVNGFFITSDDFPEVYELVYNSLFNKIKDLTKKELQEAQ